MNMLEADFAIVRAILGLLNAAALIAFGRSVQKAFGTSAGIWYALFQASQFHIMYYASRTLPNMFALIFSKSHDQTRGCMLMYLSRQSCATQSCQRVNHAMA
jgi:hypothetical protein